MSVMEKIMMNENLIISKAMERVEELEVLDCQAFWQRHDSWLIRSPRVERPSFFYPVYRFGNSYSFSPLPLILKKGYLRIDPRSEEYLRHTKGDVTPPEFFIDPEIERIGGPPVLTRTLRDRQDFCQKMAIAMQDDITEIEERNSGKTNIVLCGGKDSLNLLLLNWRNPTIVYSAAPNFSLVRKFVSDNQLDFDVFELKEKGDDGLKSREVIEACCMVNLENWRWASHLRQIARSHDFQAVFWKGQFADAVLTDYWRSYTSSFSRPRRILKKIYKRAARNLPVAVTAIPDLITLADFRSSIWQRGAVMQGAHMGALRSITDCLFVSAYHGPRSAQVWLSADLPNLTPGDMRPEIGRILLGREVNYPTENPSPPASPFRKNLRSIEALEVACNALGITVKH